jgi:type VI secretion system protein ImpL
MNWLSLGLWIGGGLIAAVALFFGVRWFIKRRKKKKSEQPVQVSVSPQVRAALKAKVAKLDEVLQSSKRAGNPELSKLPRVLVIGPKGSGKSSAVRGSRLQFKFESAPQGPSGELDVALSAQGSLFDVPGRYLDDDGPDHAAWLELLRLLAEAKKPVAIDAILLVVAIDDLLSASPDDAEALGQRLRRRLHEAFALLGWCMPVHVLFAKSDRIYGFADTFATAGRDVFKRPLGFASTSDEPEHVRAEIDRLIEGMRTTQRSRFVSFEQSVRSNFYVIPEQLESAAQVLESLLRRLYERSAEGDRMHLGGVYFGSAVQDKATIDRTGARAREVFSLSGRPQLPREEASRSLFLPELFARVVLSGASPQLRSARGRRRHRTRTVGGLAVLSAGALFVGGLSAISYLNNRDLIASTAKLAKATRRPESDLAPSNFDRLNPLGPVAARLEELETWETDRPLFHRFGFYSGTELLPPLRRAFERPMQEMFVDLVGIELESMLGDATGSGDVATDYDVLKAYLMLTKEKARLDPSFVAPVLVEVWKRRLDQTASGETELLVQLATVFVREVQRGAIRWPAPSGTLISDARASLKRRSAELERMVASTRKQAGQPRSLSDIVGGQVPDALRAGRTIDPLYTLQGWNKVKISFQKSPEGAESWVLGDHASDDRMVQAAQEQYLEHFSSEWQRFLRELTIREARSLPDVRRVLTELTEKPSVLEKLLLGMKAQMKFPSIDEDALEAAGKIKGKAGDLAKKATAKNTHEKNRVEIEFAPLFELVAPSPDATGATPAPALAALVEKLAKVKSAIEKLEASPDADTKELESAVLDAKEGVDSVFRSVPEPIAKLVKPLFLDALRGVTSEAESERYERTNKNFSDRVCALFDETIAGRYPFASKSDQDALPDSVAAMFSPGGMAWTFFDGALQQDLIKLGDSTNVEAKPNSKVSKDVLAFYKRAAFVRAALFPKNQPTLDRDFDVRLPKGYLSDPGANVRITGVTLEVGTEKKTFKFGPDETGTFHWPTKVGRARLSLEGLSEPIETWGDWSLFRLAERATVKPLESGWVELTFSFKGGAVRVPLHLRTSGTINPLLDIDRLRMSCPRVKSE